MVQVDPSLAFNNPVPAMEPVTTSSPPQSPAALAPLPELPAQTLPTPAPKAAAAITSPAPMPTPKPPPTESGSSAAGGGGSNGTVSTFLKGGKEYFITIGPDGNFQNACQMFFPTGWNQYGAL